MRTRTTARCASFADVLEGLRQTRYRQIMRGRHPPVLDTLHTLGLIDWTRQADRASHYLAATRTHADAYRPPVDIATLTAAGRAALDRLVALERMPVWPEHSGKPYAS